MWQNFVLWLQKPGEWNDAVFACFVLLIGCVVGMIVNERRENVNSYLKI